MLDVHPPHAPTHTWRDFLIHIATIVVGLIIAVGLEQTVEALHRVRERRVLIEDIHAECENNLKALAVDVDFYKSDAAWTLATVAALRAAPVVQGQVVVVLPPHAKLPSPPAPSRAVWTTAKSSGKVALLPENLAEVFDRVDREAEQTLSSVDKRNASEEKTDNFGVLIGTPLEPGATLHLTPAQRDLLMESFVTAYGNARAVLDWGASWQGASRAVLNGATTRSAMDKPMLSARTALGRKN